MIRYLDEPVKCYACNAATFMPLMIDKVKPYCWTCHGGYWRWFHWSKTSGLFDRGEQYRV